MAASLKPYTGAMLSLDTTSAMASKAFGDRGRGVHWTDDPRAELPVKVSSDATSAASAVVTPPVTLMHCFYDTVAATPSAVAMRVKRGGVWTEWTFAQYLDEVKRFGRACLHPAIDLQRGAGVAIIAFNSPEWAISAYGAIFAGGVQAGVYTTNTPEALRYVVDHCDAAVLVVDDAAQLDKALAIRHTLPKLKAIVTTLAAPPASAWSSGDGHLARVYTWSEFMGLGASVPETALVERMNAQRPGHCCTLIYTSGTTGDPKAVMLSHDNVAYTCRATNSVIQAKPGDVIVSYLPLSHVAAQAVDMHGGMITGVTIAFAQPDALKGSLIQTLQEVRPHYFLGVPRVYEKIEERLRAIGAANTGIKKAIGEWAKRVGTAGSRAKLEGLQLPLAWTVADAVIFRNIKRALGLDRCRILATGAAPISHATLAYFASLDMVLVEVYGMSESTGPHSANRPHAGGTKLGTVGLTLPGAETRIDVPSAGGEGEVCMRGRNVFMGYLKNAKATMDTIDEEGFLHSGDLGVLDDEGFLRITGRIKELLITAGGENVAPTLMEDAIKELCPAISNVMCVGDRRKFIGALITLKTEPDAEGAPTDTPLDVTFTFLKSVGSTATTASAAARCPKVKAAIQDVVTRANAKAISNAARVAKWAMVAPDFSVSGGELTPTLKLKRRVVTDKYAAVIESLYAEAEGGGGFSFGGTGTPAAKL